MEAAHMTAVLAAQKQGTAARDAIAAGHDLARAAAWLGRAYIATATAVARHHAPADPMQAAAFAVTLVLVLMIVSRGRKRRASA
jgi:hypothetical protein